MQENPVTDKPAIKLDYLQLRLDVLSNLLNSISSPLHENEFGSTVRELRVMRFVRAEPGLTLGRLTALTVIEKTSLSKLVTGLVTRGWLVREVGVKDARNINLYLTEAGEDIVQRADDFSRQWERSFLSVLTQDELAHLIQCIEKLTSHGRRMLS